MLTSHVLNNVGDIVNVKKFINCNNINNVIELIDLFNIILKFHADQISGKLSLCNNSFDPLECSYNLYYDKNSIVHAAETILNIYLRNFD